MEVTVTCGYCQKQFHYDYIPVMDSPITGECSWCADDICESCVSTDDDEYHEPCLENAEQEQDE